MSTRNVQREIKIMLREIAEELGCDYELVESIYAHEFEFASNQITKGERGEPNTFETILLKHFGTFIANEKHILKLKEISDAKERTNN